MQFRLFSFALIVLNCMDYGHCQPGRWRRSKREYSSKEDLSKFEEMFPEFLIHHLLATLSQIKACHIAVEVE
ncbi:hypothetical protein TURU_067296 [Turdus rufiventris]|nr:hypothetical protein TURU_067296 [Turdus rufiventris]